MKKAYFAPKMEQQVLWSSTTILSGSGVTPVVPGGVSFNPNGTNESGIEYGD